MDTPPELPDWLQKLYPFTPRSACVGKNGYRLAYLDEGPHDAPVVLCLHGNPTWSFYYRDLVLALRDRFRVIVPDHLGMGLSEKPQDHPYRLSCRIGHVEELIAHLGLTRFDLVMHDWGGAIGMGLATCQPERVGRLVVTNTAAFRAGRMPRRIALCRTPGLGRFLVRGLNAFAGGATFMATAQGLPREVCHGYLYPYANWHDRVAVHAFVRDIPRGPGHPTWETLGEIESRHDLLREKPMLLLWGLKDFCFTPAFLRQWQERFPHASTVEYAHAGHYVLEDTGEAAREEIARFLSD